MIYLQQYIEIASCKKATNMYTAIIKTRRLDEQI